MWQSRSARSMSCVAMSKVRPEVVVTVQLCGVGWSVHLRGTEMACDDESMISSDQSTLSYQELAALVTEQAATNRVGKLGVVGHDVAAEHAHPSEESMGANMARGSALLEVAPVEGVVDS